MKPGESPSDGAPAAGRRGRKRIQPAPSVETKSPSNGRRRKREEKPAENPTEPASAGRRSKRAKATSAASAKTKSPSKKRAADISDEDLTKATSQAAQELSPGAVMDVLEQFGVSEIRDLDQGQRKEFVALLQEARDAA